MGSEVILIEQLGWIRNSSELYFGLYKEVKELVILKRSLK